MQDMWSLAAIMLSVCLMAEAAGLKIIDEWFLDTETAGFLMMGLLTLGIITAAVTYLRKTLDILKVEHD